MMFDLFIYIFIFIIKSYIFITKFKWKMSHVFHVVSDQSKFMPFFSFSMHITFPIDSPLQT